MVSVVLQGSPVVSGGHCGSPVVSGSLRCLRWSMGVCRSLWSQLVSGGLHESVWMCLSLRLRGLSRSPCSSVVSIGLCGLRRSSWSPVVSSGLRGLPQSPALHQRWQFTALLNSLLLYKPMHWFNKVCCCTVINSVKPWKLSCLTSCLTDYVYLGTQSLLNYDNSLWSISLIGREYQCIL